MKTFLCKNKRPVIRWGQLPNETYFEGTVPEGFSLAVSPWGYDGYVVIDVDKHGNKNGFNAIPKYSILKKFIFKILGVKKQSIYDELEKTLSYKTKNDGKHYWVKYTGTQQLGNKTSGLGIDLRTNKGYVVWYHDKDIRDCLSEINESSPELNLWLEKLFGYKLKSYEFKISIRSRI